MEDTVKIFTLDKKDETIIPLIEETFKSAGIEWYKGKISSLNLIGINRWGIYNFFVNLFKEIVSNL